MECMWWSQTVIVSLNFWWCCLLYRYKQGYFGIAILVLNKALIYNFDYDYINSQYGIKILCYMEVCYMDIDSFLYEIDWEDFYSDLNKNIVPNFNTSRYVKDNNRPLPIGRNKYVIGIMKQEVDVKKMADFAALWRKMYAYRKLDHRPSQHEHNKLKDKNCKETKNLCSCLKHYFWWLLDLLAQWENNIQRK